MINFGVDSLRTVKELQQLDGLDIDFAVLDLNTTSFSEADAKQIADMDIDVRTIGKLSKPSLTEALNAVDDFKLDMLLLEESDPEFCSDMSEETEVIKLFTLSAAQYDTIDKLIAPFDEHCDYYMFTAGDASHDSLLAFTEALSKARIEKPFFVAAPDVQKLKTLSALHHPDFFSVILQQQGNMVMAKVLEGKLALNSIKS